MGLKPLPAEQRKRYFEQFHPDYVPPTKPRVWHVLRTKVCALGRRPVGALWRVLLGRREPDVHQADHSAG